MENKNWKAQLKTDFGIEAKSRDRQNSIFAIVKEVLKTENTCKDEVVYKILEKLKAKNVEVTKEVYKKVNKLLSNLMTYLRHPTKYVAYSDHKLIESNEKIQMVIRK